MDDDTAEVVGTLMKCMPLLTAKGVDFRRKAQANLAVALLRQHDGRATLPQVQETWRRISFGYARPEALQAVLADAHDLGYVEHHGEDYSLTANVGKETLNDQLEGIFPKFELFLRQEWGDRYDPYLTPQCKTAFGPCVRHMFLHVAQATLSRSGAGQVSYDRLAWEFENIAKDHGVQDAHGYADSLVVWLKQNLVALGPIAVNLLTLVATLRLLQVKNQLGQATARSIRGTELYLDTNIVVQLLCPATSSWFQAAEQVLKLGRSLGIQFKILDCHVQETEDLVRFTVETLSQAGGRPGWIGSTNQLLQEFAEANVHKAEFIQRIQNFREVIGRHEVNIVPVPQEAPSESQQMVGALRLCFEANEDLERAPRAIERDGIALHLLEKIQEQANEPFPGPWLVTFDRKLVACEAMYRSVNGGPQAAMLVGSWIAGMTGVISLTDDPVNLEEFAAAWIGVGVAPAVSFTEKQVMTVLAAGFDLPLEAQARFVRESLRAEVAREAGRRLRRHEMEAAGQLLEEMTRRGMEALSRDVSTKEAEIKRLREKVRLAYSSQPPSIDGGLA